MNKTAVKTKAGRSFERQEFLTDVLTTALEGGIGYWCRVDDYRWFSPTLSGGTATHEEVDGVQFPNAYATGARDQEEDGKLLGDITVETIAKGIRLILAKDSPIRLASDYVSRIFQADHQNDAGIVDALDCDAIVQVGLLGDVVYG